MIAEDELLSEARDMLQTHFSGHVSLEVCKIPHPRGRVEVRLVTPDPALNADLVVTADTLEKALLSLTLRVGRLLSTWW